MAVMQNRPGGHDLPGDRDGFLTKWSGVDLADFN